MKKNKIMRIASVLLVAVLLSTCAISGTFAKYVTTVSGTDTARVAEWGIKLGANHDVDTFEAKYDSSVDAGADNVVAPGTTESAVYQLQGAPEVSYDVRFTLDNITEIYLGEGTYTYPSGYDASMSVTVASGSEYYPIKWTVKLETTNGDITGEGLKSGDNEFDTLTLAKVAIDKTIVTFAPNEECDVKLTITWEWDFDDNGNGTNDAKDTVLGDLINTVGPVTASSEAKYSTKVEYKLTLKATQIN